MEHSELVADFAKRTLENLDYVQKGVHRGDAGVFEVTQLWNSLLGLIVLPHERVIKRLPTSTVADVSLDRWPVLTKAGRAPKSLRDLVRHLRNAVAHFNVEFHAGSNGEITSVTVWNQKTRETGHSHSSTRNWEGLISVGELEVLARLIANTYISRSASYTR